MTENTTGRFDCRIFDNRMAKADRVVDVSSEWPVQCPRIGSPMTDLHVWSADSLSLLTVSTSAPERRMPMAMLRASTDMIGLEWTLARIVVQTVGLDRKSIDCCG